MTPTPKDQRPAARVALGLIITGAVLRLIPHPPNVAPVGAMSLFAGARLNGWQAYLVPLMLMLITDPILGAIHGFSPFARRTFFIYGSFMISVWIGRHLRDTDSPLRIGGAAFLCALQFYLITNLPSCLSGMYTHDLAGLITCYIAALPFFGLTLLGNLLYSALFFGSHAWLTRRSTATVTIRP